MLDVRILTRLKRRVARSSIRSNIPTGPVQPAMPTLSVSQDSKENRKGLWDMIIINSKNVGCFEMQPLAKQL
jgi:hypothetical protein